MMTKPLAAVKAIAMSVLITLAMCAPAFGQNFLSPANPMSPANPLNPMYQTANDDRDARPDRSGSGSGVDVSPLAAFLITLAVAGVVAMIMRPTFPTRSRR